MGVVVTRFFISFPFEYFRKREKLNVFIREYLGFLTLTADNENIPGSLSILRKRFAKNSFLGFFSISMIYE